MLKLKKTLEASRSYGRGMDNVRTPGRYEVWVDGKVIGRIIANSARPYERSRWEFRPVDKAMDVPCAYSRKELVGYIEARLNDK